VNVNNIYIDALCCQYLAGAPLNLAPRLGPLHLGSLYTAVMICLPMPCRRFPPPWTIDDNGSCFIVKDDDGHALAYAYYENEPLDAGLLRIL
jgi:hypothetical protein